MLRPHNELRKLQKLLCIVARKTRKLEAHCIAALALRTEFILQVGGDLRGSKGYRGR
jgi:hypothetical protein